MSATNTIEELLNSKTVAESGKLNPPFVMSNIKTDGKEYVTVADVESSDNQIDVKLKRRVARFDLLNDPAESGLVIDKVYIKNRYTQGFIGHHQRYPFVFAFVFTGRPYPFLPESTRRMRLFLFLLYHSFCPWTQP